MKTSFSILLAAALVGCATRSPVVVTQTVGPDLAAPRVQLSQNQGQLVVYSAVEAADVVGSRFPTHSAYKIFDANGKLLQTVDNRSGSFNQTPPAISLAPGEYKIKARATNHGLVTLTVAIKENETTTVDLEGSHFAQHKPTGAGQWVRLPSGEVVGMREL